MPLVGWARNLAERLRRPRKLLVHEGDSLPEALPDRALTLAREVVEDWCVGMRCPCGCGRTIELLLIPEARPRWSLMVDKKGRPSVYPSVWLREGCRSHFWVCSGRVKWC